MKKLLAMLLALAMVLSLVACGGGDTETTSPAPAATNGAEATEAPQAAVDPNATYTYNSATTVFPTNWSVTNNQTNDDNDLLLKLNGSFYDFDYNETKDGFKLVPSAAAGEPVDITAELVGKFGIVEGDTARAYKVPLREDLKWEDGTPINANDFVETAKRMLAPEAQNFRADLFYAGSFVVHNAENYLKQGQTLATPNTAVLADLVKGADGVYTLATGEPLFLSMTETGSPNNGGYSLTGLHDAGYINDEVFNALNGMADENGKIPYTDEARDTLFKFTGSADWGNEPEETLETYAFFDKNYPAMDFSEVGVYAASDYELVYVIDQPLSGFDLKYNMPAYLVKLDLYDSLGKMEGGIYTNTYCTSAETTMSWGPYKLTSFQMDKQYILERNENYYNLTPDTYQTTHIVVDMVPEASTRLELFLQGKLDAYKLDKVDMETYQLSDYTYWSTSPSLFAMAFNPDLKALEEKQKAAGENINKTILTIPEFRQAFSFAMDRSAFCLATSPTNAPALALYSNVHIYDPESGATYRATQPAKEVMAKFWGVDQDYGEGKMYADIDEAIDSITGYNLDKAKQLFDVAYDKAIADGLMDEDDVVEIKIGMPNSTSGFYNDGYEFIVNNYTEAVKGTKLEGKLTFSKDDTLGNAFGEALRNNQVDMLFGVGFSGSAMDPFGFFEVWISANWGGTLQYDDYLDYGKVDATINIDGVDYTASVVDWFYVMNGQATEITAADGTTIEYSCGSSDNDPETRLHILANLESIVLMNYNFIPLLDDSAAQLKSQQVNYGTEEYVYGMEFGGFQYYTYNYTDAEWDAYVAENGGTLDYT